MSRKKIGTVVYHIIVCGMGIIMIYPLLWMIMSSFKESSTIFSTARSLIPENFILDNYKNGWKGFGKTSFSVFFKNSMLSRVQSRLFLSYSADWVRLSTI